MIWSWFIDIKIFDEDINSKMFKRFTTVIKEIARGFDMYNHVEAYRNGEKKISLY